MAYEFYITPEEYKIAEANGIGRQTLEKRIRRNAWSKERALSEPVLEVCIEMKKWRVIAKANGIKRTTFNNRVRELRWNMEDAATIPTLTPKEVVENLKKFHKS